jgi:transposase
MKAAPEPVLQAMAPYREARVVGVDCLFTWSGRADLCAQEGLPFVLGQALSMKAIHGGKAKHDQIDAHNLAVLRRGGMMPRASVYPAARRATRDLLRRRMSRPRTRAELLTHVQQTHGQDHVPDLGNTIAYKATRVGGAERCPDPAVQQSIAGALALIAYDAQLLRALEWAMVTTATPPEAHPLDVRQTAAGIGKLLRLVLLDEIHDSTRCPRGQDFVSSCRLVTCAKASAGKRYGTSGTKIGNASLKWAFAEAAALFLRNNPAGQQSLARFARTHGQGQALTALAHKRARAVYDMLNRGTAVARGQFLRGSGSGAGEPTAELGHHRVSLTIMLGKEPPPASANAQKPIGTLP